MITAPAFFNRFITVESYGDVKSFNILEAHVVFTFSIQKLSLTAITNPSILLLATPVQERKVR